MTDQPQTLHCSFCGRSQDQVTKLIAGPDVYICDNCVSICLDLMGEGVAKELVTEITREMHRVVSEALARAQARLTAMMSVSDAPAPDEGQAS